MIGHLVAIVFLDSMFCVLFSLMMGDFFFNPITNYEKWEDLNWIGVGFFSLVYWVMFLPVTIGVVTGWAIIKLFTFGRR